MPVPQWTRALCPRSHSEQWQGLKRLCEFPGAAVTHSHRPGGFKPQDVFIVS